MLPEQLRAECRSSFPAKNQHATAASPKQQIDIKVRYGQLPDEQHGYNAFAS